MDTALITQMTAMQASQTQSLVGISMLKKQHEMDMSLVAMIEQAVRSVPPPGQGLVVDKTA